MQIWLVDWTVAKHNHKCRDVVPGFQLQILETRFAFLVFFLNPVERVLYAGCFDIADLHAIEGDIP